MKQIIVNVSGLSAEEKQRVSEALAKIIGIEPCMRAPRWSMVYSMHAPSLLGHYVGWVLLEARDSTHTPQQVLEMAGMAKQGHVHAELMAQYAEDAKTTDKPWELWQVKTGSLGWLDCKHSPFWVTDSEYRRKPKTHTVNGVEVPDLRIDPKKGDRFYLVDLTEPEFTFNYAATSGDEYDSVWAERGLCYEPTEEGKQAAILHAKAWLGIA